MVQQYITLIYSQLLIPSLLSSACNRDEEFGASGVHLGFSYQEKAFQNKMFANPISTEEFGEYATYLKT